MVNLDKWEKIKFDDIKAGDKIKRANINSDGTRAVVTGKVHKFQHISGTWVSKDLFAIVLCPAKYPADLYRRKPKPFKFPGNFGAMIEGSVKTSADSYVIGKCSTTAAFQQFVLCQEGMWRNSAGTGFSEKEIRSSFDNLAVLSEGIK